MSNFKVNFLNNNINSGTFSLEKCCEPSVVNLVCSNLKLGDTYDLTLANNSAEFADKIFPSKYTFTATSSLQSIDVISGGLYINEPTIVLNHGETHLKAHVSLNIIRINNYYSISSVNIINSGDGYKTLPSVNIIGQEVIPSVLIPRLFPINKYVTFLVSFNCNDDGIPQPPSI